MSDAVSRLLAGNRMLAAMPEAEVALLRPHLEHNAYDIGTVLADSGSRITRCFFPIKGMISLLSVTEQGETIEVAYAGRESMAGLAAVLEGYEAHYQMLVQADTECLVADARNIRRLFESGPAFRALLLRYVYALLKQMSQTCVCNHFHTIEQRLCRWLTVMCERSGNRRLSVTQEFLSHILGVQRTSIGLVANAMQAKGIIRYSRGKVDVIDIERLRENSCECYRIVNAELEALYRTNGRRK